MLPPMDQATLTPEQTETAVRMLRLGNTATDAAAMADVKPAQLYAAARHDQDLLLALAGHDPYAYDASQTLEQADYIRLMALGLTPTQASRVLFHGDERVKSWRSQNEEFAKAADYTRRLHPPRLRQRREHRFTPYRVGLFLTALEQGLPVTRAAEEAGITNAVVYQRRRRDAQFRDSMDQARARAAAPQRAEATVVLEEQWVRFRRGVANGMTLRRAALGAGIPPQRVYDRRRSDPAFRADTDRWRGRCGALQAAANSQEGRAS